jgi:hypothetical protein
MQLLSFLFGLLFLGCSSVATKPAAWDHPPSPIPGVYQDQGEVDPVSKKNGFYARKFSAFVFQKNLDTDAVQISSQGQSVSVLALKSGKVVAQGNFLLESGRLYLSFSTTKNDGAKVREEVIITAIPTGLVVESRVSSSGLAIGFPVKGESTSFYFFPRR